MKIKAIAPWFGGKRTMAPEIVELLGPHTQYFEPFCGSMAVLFAKQPSQKETVNDLHGGAICLARVVADEMCAPQLYDRLQRTLVCEGLLDDAREFFDHAGTDGWWKLNDDTAGELPGCFRVDANMTEYAYWYFVASWMGRNGTAGTERVDYQIAVRWTRGGGSPTVRFRNAVDSIPAWHERLRNVVILRRDAFDILNRFEDHKTTAIYADPPYAGETRSNTNVKAGGGGRYLHDFKHDADLFEPDQHTELADRLNQYNHARIVVSYYDCPRIRGLYDGWRIIDKTQVKNLHAQNGRGAPPKEAPEILIVNF